MSDAPDERRRSAGTKRRRSAAAASEPSSERSDASRPSSEETGEDLLDERLFEDYKDLGVLDQYDPALLDDRDYGGLDHDTRRAAEIAMAERDAREGRGRGRLAAALESDEDEGSIEGFRARQRRRREMEAEEAEAIGEAEPEVDEPFNLESFDVPLREWLLNDKTKREVQRRFKRFMETFTLSNGERIHERVIDEMAASNGSSLYVSYLHIAQAVPILAIWLADMPKLMLDMFDEVAKDVVLARFPDYFLITDEIHVRVTNMPIVDSLRDLRQLHLNSLVKVEGVVMRRSAVFPQLKVVQYTCSKCGAATGPTPIQSQEEPRPEVCLECQGSGPFVLNTELTIYRNFQRLTLQEAPGKVPAGRVPRQKEVIVLGDLIDRARPGEEVTITGVYTHIFDAALNTKQGFPVFSTVIEANYVERRGEGRTELAITDADREQIDALSKDPKVVQRIVRSIAPSIYGHEHVKLALALSMFGGQEKNVNQKHRIRGDINVLLLGDPGTAKSQFLKYVEKTAPRAVYTTGKGASAVGLTASVHKDPASGEWMLEGGALVLADMGICLIDEFDKMSDQDRTSIHEAMEQQSISISKAGIVTTLQARCAVIAAANPIGGRYDIAKTFSENVQLTDPILTRFDVLCVVRDEVDPALDERLATFVVDSHSRAHPAVVKAREDAKSAGAADAELLALEASHAGEMLSGSGKPESPPISQDLLKKYINEAKLIKPQLTGIDEDKIARLYADLRRESEISSGIPIAVRHIESIIRMSEAAARMRMSSYVSDADLNLAIKVMLDSFIFAQKFSVMRSLRRQFSRYLDVGLDYSQLLLTKLRELVRAQQASEFVRRGREGFTLDDLDTMEVATADLQERARRHGIPDGELHAFLTGDLLKSAGFSYVPERRVILRHF